MKHGSSLVVFALMLAGGMARADEEGARPEIFDLLRVIQEKSTHYAPGIEPVPVEKTEAFAKLQQLPAHLATLHAIIQDLTVDDDLRVCALEVLGALKNRQSVYPILLVLDDDNDHLPVRVKAIEVSEHFADRRAILVLTKILRKEDSATTIDRDGEVLHHYNRWAQIKRSAAEVLVRWGPDERVVSLLTRYLEEGSDSPSTMRYSAYCLGRLGAKRAVEPLLDLLEQTLQPDVESEILEALGRLGSVESIGRQIEALENPEEVVALSAVRALGHLGALATKAIDPLVGILASSKQEWMLRATVPAAMVRIGSTDERVARALVEGLGVVVEGAPTEREKRLVHVACMVALQFVRHPGVIPALVARLGEEDPEIRQASGVLLRKLTGESFEATQAEWASWWEKNKEGFRFVVPRSEENK